MPEPRFLTFDSLLDRALTDPGAEAELERRYQRDAATLVVNFTGMVHRTDHEGILYALALARAAERVMEPAVEAHGGEIVKKVADSFFAVFTSAREALLAALDGARLMAAFNQTRTGTPGDGQRNDPIHPCMGLGSGPTLVIPGENVYGAEVNRAFVLGEDTARAGEVLCTPAFASALGDVPAGVGLRAARTDRIDEVGFPFHVLTDWRER